MDAVQAGAAAGCGAIAGIAAGGLIGGVEQRLVWPLTIVAVVALIGIVVLALA